MPDRESVNRSQIPILCSCSSKLSVPHPSIRVNMKFALSILVLASCLGTCKRIGISIALAALI